MRPLLRMAEGDDAAVRLEALPALVNLAADEVLLETFVACSAAKRTVRRGLSLARHERPSIVSLWVLLV